LQGGNNAQSNRNSYGRVIDRWGVAPVLHAQAKSPGYLIAEIAVTLDEQTYKDSKFMMRSSVCHPSERRKIHIPIEHGWEVKTKGKRIIVGRGPDAQVARCWSTLLE
jgi:hypothetical protein